MLAAVSAGHAVDGGQRVVRSRDQAVEHGGVDRPALGAERVCLAEERLERFSLLILLDDEEHVLDHLGHMAVLGHVLVDRVADRLAPRVVHDAADRLVEREEVGVDRQVARQVDQVFDRIGAALDSVGPERHARVVAVGVGVELLEHERVHGDGPAVSHPEQKLAGALRLQVGRLEHADLDRFVAQQFCQLARGLDGDSGLLLNIPGHLVPGDRQRLVDVRGAHADVPHGHVGVADHLAVRGLRVELLAADEVLDGLPDLVDRLGEQRRRVVGDGFLLLLAVRLGEEVLPRAHLVRRGVLVDALRRGRVLGEDVVDGPDRAVSGRLALLAALLHRGRAVPLAHAHRGVRRDVILSSREAGRLEVEIGQDVLRLRLRGVFRACGCLRGSLLETG